MAQQMGIGLLGDANIVFKRKFRWTFSINPLCGKNPIPPNFVKMAARPNLSIEETEINYLNAKTWIPGKGSWESITVTYIDVSGSVTSTSSGGPINLYNWLASVYDFSQTAGSGSSSTGNIQLNNGANRNAYAATGTLVMYDGSGTSLEQWVLSDMWPTAVNFGDLDYSSSDTVDIELTLRYSAVQYTSYCPGASISPCVTSCA